MSLADECAHWADRLDLLDEHAYQKLKDTVSLNRSDIEGLVRVLRDARDVLHAEVRLLHQIAKQQDEQPA